MMWTKLTIDTTVEAVDLISAFLDEKGVEGVMIEDHVPLTEEDKAAMFVDIPLVDGVDDGTAKVSCYIDDSFNIETLRADIAAELTRLEAFIPVGSKNITLSNTEDKDWMNNWKTLYENTLTPISLLLIPCRRFGKLAEKRTATPVIMKSLARLSSLPINTVSVC